MESGHNGQEQVLKSRMRLVIPAHLEDLLRSSKLLIRRQWDNGIDHGRPMQQGSLLGRNIDGCVVIP
jgi:hypothetical protein